MPHTSSLPPSTQCLHNTSNQPRFCHGTSPHSWTLHLLIPSSSHVFDPYGGVLVSQGRVLLMEQWDLWRDLTSVTANAFYKTKPTSASTLFSQINKRNPPVPTNSLLNPQQTPTHLQKSPILLVIFLLSACQLIQIIQFMFWLSSLGSPLVLQQSLCIAHPKLGSISFFVQVARTLTVCMMFLRQASYSPESWESWAPQRKNWGFGC